MFHFLIDSSTNHEQLTVADPSLEQTVLDAEQCLRNHECAESCISIIDTLSGDEAGTVALIEGKDMYLHLEPNYAAEEIQLAS